MLVRFFCDLRDLWASAAAGQAAAPQETLGHVLAADFDAN